MIAIYENCDIENLALLWNDIMKEYYPLFIHIAATILLTFFKKKKKKK